MSVYESLMRGLNEVVEYERGNLKNVCTRTIKIKPLPNYNAEDVKNIRINLNLTQNVFALTLGVSKKTVEAWESGKNVPIGPAQRMLEIISKDKSIVEELVTIKG